MPAYDTALGLLLTLALLALAAAGLRLRAEHEPGVLLTLVPPDGSPAEIDGWTRCFQSLQAAERRGWRGALFGQPRLVFEYVSDRGRLEARCWVPAGLEWPVRMLLESAVPGLEISAAS